ncbi:hypothetical protein LTR84_009217 [Exophiala bonariae]|uniref:Uncharacterized protein n=1 Tax=Exophiala bonariae TaxID=1690606 RepID=A0AAV9MVF8_9EURO|nr:hypothetical protein LTR84_009217 [Exophiala bonariae]
MQWLITGCSSGLGLSLARAVLTRPGEKVIATSRNPSSSPEAVNEIINHDKAVWETLDVSAPDVEIQLAKIVSKHGAIDVLVNNAGYAAGGVFEVTPLEALRQQFETNFFGAVRLMQAVVPGMRTSGKGGVIVNISSNVFWQPLPVISAYSASKWALEGFSEAIAGEISPFNIRMIIAEPGGMRTSFLEPSKMSSLNVDLPATYRGTIAETLYEMFAAMHGEQALDPERSARALVKEVLEPTSMKNDETGAPQNILRLQLGKETVGTMQKKIMTFQTEAEVFQAQAFACDFDA